MKPKIFGSNLLKLGKLHEHWGKLHENWGKIWRINPKFEQNLGMLMETLGKLG